jgi:hypothetical protein
VRNSLAGKKARVLYRNPDGSTVLHVEDEHDEILVTVDPDGSMLEERWSGLAGVGEALAAASPYDKMQVPNDAERKVWTHLVEDEPPAAVPEPEPALGPPPGRRVVPQYEPPREERDTPFTRWLSWGPGNI